MMCCLTNEFKISGCRSPCCIWLISLRRVSRFRYSFCALSFTFHILISYVSCDLICSFLQSPVDGKPMLLTPEESIQIQVGTFRGCRCSVIYDLVLYYFLSQCHTLSKQDAIIIPKRMTIIFQNWCNLHTHGRLVITNLCQNVCAFILYHVVPILLLISH